MIKRIRQALIFAVLLAAAVIAARAQGPSLCFDAKGLHVDFTQTGPASTPIWTAKISVDGKTYFLGVDARRAIAHPKRKPPLRVCEFKGRKDQQGLYLWAILEQLAPGKTTSTAHYGVLAGGKTLTGDGTSRMCQ
jgi:hypothetical protein